MKAEVTISNIYWDKGLSNFFFREQAYKTLEELVTRSTMSGQDTLDALDEATDDMDIEEDAEKLAGDIYELTEEGEDLCYRYFHDLSCGYDLCNGRAKGLAAEYSREEFFAYVTDKKNGYIK